MSLFSLNKMREEPTQLRAHSYPKASHNNVSYNYKRMPRRNSCEPTASTGNWIKNRMAPAAYYIPDLRHHHVLMAFVLGGLLGIPGGIIVL